MPMWRCPHCGTPQAETARCWVCRRSSTACGTCRNFRRSVAGSLGYCGLDRRRQPLAGDEIRECWEASAGDDQPLSAMAATPAPATAALPASRSATPLEFIEVHGPLAPEPVVPDAAAGPAPNSGSTPTLPTDGTRFVRRTGPPPGQPGWSLWGDIDR